MENTSYLSNAPQLWMLDILHRVAVIHFQPVSGGEENEGSTHTFHCIATKRPDTAKGARSLINSLCYRHMEQSNQNLLFSQWIIQIQNYKKNTHSCRLLQNHMNICHTLPLQCSYEHVQKFGISKICILLFYLFKNWSKVTVKSRILHCYKKNISNFVFCLNAFFFYYFKRSVS